MFIKEKKKNKFWRFIFKAVILAAATYSMLGHYLLNKHDALQTWSTFFTIIGALIYPQLFFEGYAYSQREYFEAQRIKREQRREQLFTVLLLFIFIFGAAFFLYR